jgi:hypothetical protein
MNLRNAALLIAVCAAPGPAAERVNPLSELPSKPGPHIAKIQALGDNAWLDLGCSAPDPTQGEKEGVARGRAWGGRSLCAAPDLRGAFFCGTGVHGYVKSNGHYMDDLWFYDLHAHRWICLYPGADKEMKLHLNKHGFEVNEQGDPIPVSYLSHAYGNMTYDPDRQKLVIVWSQCPWWSRALPQRWDWLGIPKEKRRYGNAGPIVPEGRHPLFWDVKTGKWERRFVAKDDADGFETRGRPAWAHVTEYVPALKKVFHGGPSYRNYRDHAGWLYDYETNSWTEVRTPAKPPGKPAGHNGCYDSKRNRVYTLGGKRMACFDFKTKTWTDVEAEGQPENFGSSNNGRLTFDTANGVLVWHPNDGPKGNIRVCDPDKNAWETPERTLPKPAYKGMVHGFYDPDLNAHFYYIARDSRNTNTTMLVYRYKRAAGAETERDE